MIGIEQIANFLTSQFNTLSDYNFKIYADSEFYKQPTFENNVEINHIQGIASILNSSIIPVNNIKIATQTIGVEILIPVKTGLVYTEDENGNQVSRKLTIEDSILPIIKIFTNYFSISHKETLQDNNENFTTTFTGSAPVVNSVENRNDLGLSANISMVLNFAFIENGINSQDLHIKFEGEDIPFTSLTLSRAVQVDGGAFADTNGISKTYASFTAFQLNISVPALKDNNLTTEFQEFLLSGTRKKYDITIQLLNGEEKTYSMIFGDGNMTAREIDNIGQSILLVEAL